MSPVRIRPKAPPKREAEIIRNAHQRALQMSEGVMRALEAIWNQPGKRKALWRRRRRAWENNLAFVRWMGEKHLTKKQMKAVHRRITKIDNRLHRTITYVIRPSGPICGANTWAWHSGLVQKRRIRLCPRFFQDDPNTGTIHGERGATIIHELAHGLGHWRVDKSNTENPLGAEKLAGSRPKAARRNPPNYEYLYRAFDSLDPL